MPLTPRELEVLDVVGEVMQERLLEVRKEYEGKLNDLQSKVAALEARPPPSLDPIWTTVLGLQERFASLPPPPEPPDLTPLTEKIAALEQRQPPERTLEIMRAMGDDLEETIERRFAMLPPPPDLTPITVKIAAWDEQPSPATVLQIAEAKLREGQADIIGRLEATIEQRFAAIPPPADLAPLTEKIAALEAEAQILRREQPDLAPLIDQAKVDRHNLDNLHERVMEIEAKPPIDLTPIEEKIAALQERASEFARTKPDRTEVTREISITTEDMERRFAALPPPVDLTPFARDIDGIHHTLAEMETRPTAEEVLKLAEGALNSTRAAMLETLQVSIVDLFKALPIPEKGDKGENGTSVTVEQFRDLFEAGYAKFELESERRIMDLVQRTLDRIPVPENGKDGVGFDDLNIVRDGRTVRHEYLRDGEVVKTFEFKSDDLQYRDVYRAGKSYERGDVVTWGGSTWLAMRDAPTGRPGVPGKPDSGDWQLLVKEGRRGRSAYDIAVGKGFAGTEADWLASLKGSPGKDAKPAQQTNGKIRGSTEP